MRVLHLAAGNRWTGAAAPAFAEVEALRAAGIDAHYAYVGGYKLEDRLRGVEFAHPIIDRAQNPFSFLRTVARIRAFVESRGIDLVHAHLTWDHLLARFAGRRVARTFHSRRTLRSDPFARMLLRGTDIVAVVNDTFRDAPVLRGREVHFTPPPVDERQFAADGEDARGQYGLGTEPVVAFIGKVAPGRGFEAAIETFALLPVAGAKMLIIGHGSHRPTLEALAERLGVAERIVWAGYHEHDLAAHYRAADVLLFSAPGSDEGHRAVLEAMACGVPVAAYPIAGIHRLLGDLAQRLVSREETPESLAAVAARVLSTSTNVADIADVARNYGYSAAANRLLSAYRSD